MAAPEKQKKTEPEETPAVDAAADEAANTALVVPWRGIELSIDRDVLTSARFLLAIRSGQDHTILWELIGPKNQDVFLATLQVGEQMPPVAAEFLDAVSKAAGWGNSEPS